VGFVNALPILIFLAQLPHLVGVPWLVYPMVAAGIAVIVLLPKLTTVVPAPLVAIVLLTAVTLTLGLSLPRVGYRGALPRPLPALLIPGGPLTMGSVGISAPCGFTMALVGLLESLMTAQFVDELPDTHSGKSRGSMGQGIATLVTGVFV